MVAEHARPYNGSLSGAFGLGECRTGFHRTLCDAQGYRTDRQPEYADEGEPGQGALVVLPAWHPRGQSPCIRFGHEDPLEGEIMAPRPGQTADFPGIIQDSDLLSGHVHHLHLRHPGRAQTRLVPFNHMTESKQPGTVLTAAGVRPAPTHEIPTLLDHRRAGGGSRAPYYHQRITAQHLLGRLIGEERSHQGRGATDEEAPAGRPIDACDLLNDAIEGEWGDLKPA